MTRAQGLFWGEGGCSDNFISGIFDIIPTREILEYEGFTKTMFITTAWHAFRLQIEEMTSRYVR
jgi:hypothetical protein